MQRCDFVGRCACWVFLDWQRIGAMNVAIFELLCDVAIFSSTRQNEDDHAILNDCNDSLMCQRCQHHSR